MIPPPRHPPSAASPRRVAGSSRIRPAPPASSYHRADPCAANNRLRTRGTDTPGWLTELSDERDANDDEDDEDDEDDADDVDGGLCLQLGSRLAQLGYPEAAVTSARRTNERTPPSPSKPDSRGSSSISSSGGHEYRRARTKQTTRKRRKRKPLDGARSPGPGTACLGEGRDPGWQRA
uniref:Uncharacterized protein n=1 Tax=Anopheles atroparvus TaxID=41427 RepID=A0A182IQN4_ANOAO